MGRCGNRVWRVNIFRFGRRFVNHNRLGFCYVDRRHLSNRLRLGRGGHLIDGINWQDAGEAARGKNFAAGRLQTMRLPSGFISISGFFLTIMGIGRGASISGMLRVALLVIRPLRLAVTVSQCVYWDISWPARRKDKSSRTASQKNRQSLESVNHNSGAKGLWLIRC